MAPRSPGGAMRKFVLVLIALVILAVIGTCHAYTRALEPGEPSYCQSVSSIDWPECKTFR
jgi:hypothetical protein